MHALPRASRLVECLVVVALLAVLPTGCGSGDDTSSHRAAPSIPAVLDICPTVDQPWRTLKGSPVPAATLGSGPTVVFANMSDNSPCNWLDFAQYLSSLGYRVVVFGYDDASPDGEKQAVTDTLAVAEKASSGSSYALVGASLGGRVVIEAASREPERLTGIVSLSGETTVQGYGDISAAARQVSTPALYVGARRDGLTEGTSQQDALHAAMHGKPDQLLQVPGTDHGIGLLYGASEGKVTAAVRDFVEARLT